MTSEEKTDGEDKRETCCGFPFGNREKMREMMRTCCPSEMKDFDCRSMMEMMMGKGRGRESEEPSTKASV